MVGVAMKLNYAFYPTSETRRTLRANATLA